MDWIPTREGIDTTAFQGQRIGPYRLGPKVRDTRFGVAVVAVEQERPHLVELERLDKLRGTSWTGPESRLMKDVAHVIGLEHPHLTPTLGAGVANKVPYLVRPYCLGRTMADAIKADPVVSEEVAVGVIYSVAEVLSFLMKEGPEPGACAMGGVELENIYLGFGGEVRLTGVGLKGPRAENQDPLTLDLTSCLALAELLPGEHPALEGIIKGSGSTRDLSTRLRKSYREACAHRVEHVATFLRARFEEKIREERAFFHMTTLH